MKNTYIDRYNITAGIFCQRELAKAISENPGLPVIFLCASDTPSYCDSDWYYTTAMEVSVIELFNSDELGDDYILSDREELREVIEEEYYNDFCNREGDISDENQKLLDARVAEEMARVEKYWVKCIRVRVGG